MNEELEQPEESENQMPDKDQNQIIEIYKLQSQLANSISNRRITIHRFYILVISGLVLIFPAFFKLPDKIQYLVPIELMVIGMSLLGITLSLAWFVLINSNLRLSMLKYEALKRLEDKLEYQFFRDEWEFLEKYGRGRTYWEVSYIEIAIPILFFIVFTILLNLVSLNFLDKFYSKLTYYPSIIIGAFCYDGLRSWQIDREIRGFKKWKSRTIDLVALGVMIAVAIIISIFEWSYSDMSHKANEKPAEMSEETSSEEIIKERIILSDEKETESVNEKPTQGWSEEATQKQTIPSNEKEQDGSQ